MSAPVPVDRSTAYQINRLRTVLAWLEDNAHTLPDGWSSRGLTGLYPELVWWDHGSIDRFWVTVDAEAVVARLTEAHGGPRVTSVGWYWPTPVGLTVYGADR